MVHQNKAKVRRFAWKCVLGTAVRLTIFSNIQLIKKKFGSNIDGHLEEESWNNEACHVRSYFLTKQWPPGKHRFAGSRKRLMHDFKVSTAHVRDINGW